MQLEIDRLFLKVVFCCMRQVAGLETFGYLSYFISAVIQCKWVVCSVLPEVVLHTSLSGS